MSWIAGDKSMWLTFKKKDGKTKQVEVENWNDVRMTLIRYFGEFHVIKSRSQAIKSGFLIDDYEGITYAVLSL